MTNACPHRHPDPHLTAGPLAEGKCPFCRLIVSGGWAPSPAAAAARPLPCAHEGAVLTFCPRGDELLHVRDCDRHGEVTRDRCRTCPDYLPDGGIAVQTDGLGIGDAVSQLYACCGLTDATGRPVLMRSRHDLGWFAGVSHPGLTLGPHDGTGAECNPDYPGQCRSADAGTVASRCRWYCDRLADALGVPAFAPDRPRAVAKPAAVREAGYAVLSPYSLHSGREWPAERWRAVCDELVGRGLHPLVIAGPGDHNRDRLAADFGPTRATWHWGQPPAWTAALIANASLFVGNDSGMAHVAGLYGTPGVAVMTLFPFEFVFAEAPSLAGVGRHGQSLADVSAAEVLAACDERLGVPVEAGRIVREKLGQRATTTEWLFAELRRRWADPRVVETGCVRSAADWSAGYFTWLCGAVLDAHGGGELVSVDNDPEHCRTARRLCSRWPRVSVVDGDSVAHLRERTEPIDLLYLDSMDTYVAGHAEHALAEAQAGERLVSERGLIAFDDTPPDGRGGWDGKGRLAVDWLLSRGWRVRPESGYQTVLERA